MTLRFWQCRVCARIVGVNAAALTKRACFHQAIRATYLQHVHEASSRLRADAVVNVSP